MPDFQALLEFEKRMLRATERCAAEEEEMDALLTERGIGDRDPIIDHLSDSERAAWQASLRRELDLDEATRPRSATGSVCRCLGQRRRAAAPV